MGIQAVTEMFLSELREKHLIDDVTFLVEGASWLQAVCDTASDSTILHIVI
jgi:hypothetical protein